MADTTLEQQREKEIDRIAEKVWGLPTAPVAPGDAALLVEACEEHRDQLTPEEADLVARVRWDLHDRAVTRISTRDMRRLVNAYETATRPGRKTPPLT